MVLQHSVNALRLLPRSTCALRTRIDPLTGAFQRISAPHTAAFNLQSPERYTNGGLLPSNSFNGSRTFATRPASRPKAHTGRVTSKPRAKKVAVVADGEAVAETSTTTTKKTTKAKADGKPGRPKKAKAKAKPKPKRKVAAKKKPVTEEDIAAAKRARIRELKKQALTPPKGLPASAFTVIISEMSKKEGGIRGKEAAEKYKNLIPEELEHYNHIAHQNKTKNEEAFAAWIKSLSAEEVRLANNARQQLFRLGAHKKVKRLTDERTIKLPLGVYILFFKHRQASGDFAHMKAPDVAKLIGAEWRSLSEDQKKPYHEEAAANRAEYIKQHIALYNREPPTMGAKASTPTEV